jgi:Fic family protein
MVVTSMNISLQDHRKRSAKERLDTLLLEGLNSGNPIPVSAEFWTELKREAMATLELRKKTAKVDRPEL